MIPDHHSGYISWEQYERHQAMLAANAYMKSQMQPKAGRGGRPLLSGVLRCRRCGRMLYVSYSARGTMVLRYRCRGAHLRTGEPRCITFSELRVDRAVAGEVLRAIGRNAVEAAAEQARYEANLAARRYEAVDPDQRLVAAELEARWNAALRKAQELDERLRDCVDAGNLAAIPDKVVLVIHWAGGRHPELRVSKRGAGQHGQDTDVEAIQAIRQMCGRFGDGEIAATLNRLSLRTGVGNTWNAQRVCGLRRQHELPNAASQADHRTVTLQQAAGASGPTSRTLRALGNIAACFELPNRARGDRARPRSKAPANIPT